MEQPEAIEVLCDCLSVVSRATTDGRLAQLSATDWDDILQLANRHSVAPLLYQRLRELEPDARIPTSVLLALAKLYLQNAARNSTLYQELGQVLAALQNADIPTIVLKGAHLAESVHDNVALRPMGDVDILVKKTGVVRAGETLLALGYTSRQRWRDMVDAASHHLQPFTKPNAAPVEIHWLIVTQIGPNARVVHPFHIDVNGLWERAQPATIAGVQTHVLSPQDLLLHLCIHASRHRKFRVRLRAFCDIAATIRRYETEIDWEQVQTRSHQWGAENCVYLTLRLARELLKVAVPDTVLENLKANDFDPQFITWAREQIFTHHGDPEDTLPDIHNLASVREAQGLGDKITTFLKIVFPSPLVMARIYPVAADSVWVYAYYLVRIKDLMIKYSRVAWRMWRGDTKVVAVAERDSRTKALLEWLAAD
jgi:hypothetical protein